MVAFLQVHHETFLSCYILGIKLEICNYIRHLSCIVLTVTHNLQMIELLRVTYGTCCQKCTLNKCFFTAFLLDNNRVCEASLKGISPGNVNPFDSHKYSP